MFSEVSETVEEYLEVIYRLQEKHGVARTNDIVAALKVAPGTVTNTVERLERETLVTHEPYRGVKLTEKGRRVALDVVRRHRLSERLLTDILHVKWSEAHEAACRLEHGFGSEITKELEKALGHPKTCPHGNPIPTKCGGTIEHESQLLIELEKGEKAMIMKITQEGKNLLQYLENQGLTPGTAIEIVEKAPFDGPITLKVGKSKLALSLSMAAIIHVKRSK